LNIFENDIVLTVIHALVSLSISRGVMQEDALDIIRHFRALGSIYSNAETIWRSLALGVSVTYTLFRFRLLLRFIVIV